MTISLDPGEAGSFDLSHTVNDVLLARPEAVRVFNALGIDACCGGGLSLRDAAHEASVSEAVLLFALARFDAGEAR